MALDPETLRDLLHEVDYRRPGVWELDLQEHLFEGWYLIIRAEIPNAYAGGDPLVVNITTCIEDFRHLFKHSEDWHEYIIKRLSRIESHETREFYWVGGKPWSDPHAEDEPFPSRPPGRSGPVFG